MMLRFFPLLLMIFFMVTVLVVPAQSAEVSEGSMQEEIRTLKQMVLDLQKRIQQLEADRVKSQGAETTATMTPKTSERERETSAKVPELEEVILVRPSSVKGQKTAKKRPMLGDGKPQALGAKPPAPLDIGGHEVRVGISGAIQADVIHDFNALGLKPSDGQAREFITANIPVGGPAADITNRTTFSPNQTYLTGWAETDTPWGPSRFMRM